jgi:hypothetical protein
MQYTFTHPRLHPLIYITSFYILGIIAQSFSSYIHSISLVPLIIVASYCTVMISAIQISTAVILISAYIAGGVCLQMHKYEYTTLYAHVAQQPCNLIAQVTALHTVDHPRFACCITLNAQELQKQGNDNWEQCNYTIQLYSKSNHDIQVGDTLGINNVLFKKPANTTSFSDYLAKEGVHGTLFLDHCDSVLINRPAYCLQRWLHCTREDLYASIKNKCSRTTFLLFSSIFLGNKQFRKKEMEHSKEHFTTWGVTHYLARSGLHMVIFVISWHFLLALLPLPFFTKELILLLLGLSYCAFSWPSVSFTRAFLAFLCYKMATLWRLPTEPLYILALVALAILLTNPLQLFFLDFQLSFGLTFALAYFNVVQAHARHQAFKQS